MGSKRRLRRKACTGKKYYATHDDAVAAARASARTFKQRLSGYKCTYCGGFHVGHTPHFVKRFVGGSTF